MKKIMGFLAVVGILTLHATLSVAQGVPFQSEEKVDMVKGKIVAIDAVKNQVVIIQKDGVETTVSVDPKNIGFFRAGNYVKVNVIPGTTEAKSIYKLKGREKRQAYINKK